jgi:hypothetical protein
VVMRMLVGSADWLGAEARTKDASKATKTRFTKPRV